MTDKIDELVEELRRKTVALLAIQSHHHEQNRLKGRDFGRSRTLKYCKEGLGEDHQTVTSDRELLVEIWKAFCNDITDGDSPDTDKLEHWKAELEKRGLYDGELEG